MTIDNPQIIMLSSCDQPVSTSALVKMGIDSYLIKPVRERRLFDTIVRVLSNPMNREPSIVMDGYEATKQIRKFELENELKLVPVIALTGHALKNDRVDCLNAGMDDYLTKPVKQDQLLEKLETYTGKVSLFSDDKKHEFKWVSKKHKKFVQ